MKIAYIRKIHCPFQKRVKAKERKRESVLERERKRVNFEILYKRI